MVRGEHGALRRAVHRVDHQAGTGVEHLTHRRRRDHVAAGEDLAQTGQRLRGLLGEHPEQAGGQMQAGDVVSGDQRAQRRGLQPARRGDDNLTAVQQRHPDLIRGHVEGVRRHQQHPLVPLEHPLRVAQQPHQLLLGHHDALRLTGGARRVDDVCQLTRVDAHPRAGGRLRGDGRVVHRDDRHAAGHAGRAGRAVDQQHHRPRVVHDPLPPVGRVGLVDRQIRPAGLEDRQERHHEIGGPLHQHTDPVLLTDPVPDEVVRQLVGPLVQLLICQIRPARGLGHGRRMRRPRDLLSKPGGNRKCCHAILHLARHFPAVVMRERSSHSS